jgi:penicillin-binding protein 1C
MSKRKKIIALIFGLAFLGTTGLFFWTKKQIKPFSNEIYTILQTPKKAVFLDRYAKPLNVTYENHWNVYNVVHIHEVPEFLKEAFLVSEDKNFYTHNGVDWLARIHAALQNISSLKVVRGASTITEQVVRMLHPRSRRVTSRWIEGFEAANLEEKFSKLEILEFYLNQIPYGGKRRGVVQAALYYFDRDISTLNEKEMLALAVLVRSPKWLDPYKNPTKLAKSVENLLQRMYEHGLIDKVKLANIEQEKLDLKKPRLEVNAQQFIHFISEKYPNSSELSIHTTLDAELQTTVQKILDTTLDGLKKEKVSNGAVLVVDHQTNEILAWVVGYATQKEKAFSQMNPVVIKRQPGSALKPFLYAKAIEKGWSAATLINDAPLEEGVGLGMHSYHNYSHLNYGDISLREALGNSLNIPAIKTIQFVGVKEFLELLHSFGITTLNQHPNLYGDGIALGNGEVTLYDLTQAYTVLARMGDFKRLSFLEGESTLTPTKRVFSEDIASLIADILSDPSARAKEFGYNSILNFPTQTAVKTGTSSDYRDAWAMGFNDKYTVGVWFGNLDYQSMNKITGSSGPAHVLRNVFHELNRNRQTHELFLSSNLIRKKICIKDAKPLHDNCEYRDELFIPSREDVTVAEDQQLPEEIRFKKPSNGLLLASDPRILDRDEYFRFELTKIKNLDKVKWYLNNNWIATTSTNKYDWKLSQGKFQLKAQVWLQGNPQPFKTKTIEFVVQ